MSTSSNTMLTTWIMNPVDWLIGYSIKLLCNKILKNIGRELPVNCKWYPSPNFATEQIYLWFLSIRNRSEKICLKQSSILYNGVILLDYWYDCFYLHPTFCVHMFSQLMKNEQWRKLPEKTTKTAGKNNGIDTSKKRTTLHCSDLTNICHHISHTTDHFYLLFCRSCCYLGNGS